MHLSELSYACLCLDYASALGAGAAEIANSAISMVTH